ncbi:pyridoxal-dependent decarboxylase [Parafrankia soli]|uniref:Pyridoxal-dependent decarboxylase n=1 Tax=Parafrankia soli TaxID=2599596 RepID=A0A1S1RA49_9ACTN|nr:pyridoxal-dependent decarboxylase [Parafrankia soli]OHV43080.1 pyridoxal-dependent decarboxylase [Parafrankia soli]
MTRPGHRPADELRDLLGVALGALDAGRRDRVGPLPAGGPVAVRRVALAALGGGRLLTAAGSGEAAALDALTRMLSAGSADPADPFCAAHLHCPPLPVAVAADLAVSALNPSLDSWDQAPAATTVETEVVAALAELAGLDPARAVGTVTTGGTESNLMGLLIGAQGPGGGGGGSGGGPRVAVLCSAAGHHSVRRGAELLGLGEVVTVPVDGAHRMDVGALRAALAGHGGPALVVATAGTTDAGAIDPLGEIAAAVRAHPAPGWLHVDAAHGGGALFSHRLSGLLAGLAEADSIALDLHKLGWQPAPAGIFLTPSGRGWERLETEAAYLNPADETAAGYPSLLGRSLRTTRRPDAFKIAVTLRALGRDRLGALVDACHRLARHAAAVIEADQRLALSAPVTLSTVLFRYVHDVHDRETGSQEALDRLNAAIRLRLLAEGAAVVGRTTAGVDGAVHLKLTLLNPAATPADVTALLALVAATGDRLAAEPAA